MNLQLDQTTEAHIEEIKTWLPDRESCVVWGGPHMRYPFINKSFEEDIRWQELATYSLTNENHFLIGFGQLYEKLDRLHLARLIINPTQRGRSYGKVLISKLLAAGLKNFSVSSASLFVYRHNRIALHCYRKMGFTEHPYPATDLKISKEYLENIIFMVKPLSD